MLGTSNLAMSTFFQKLYVWWSVSLGTDCAALTQRTLLTTVLLQILATVASCMLCVTCTTAGTRGLQQREKSERSRPIGTVCLCICGDGGPVSAVVEPSAVSPTRDSFVLALGLRTGEGRQCLPGLLGSSVHTCSSPRACGFQTVTICFFSR